MCWAPTGKSDRRACRESSAAAGAAQRAGRGRGNRALRWGAGPSGHSLRPRRRRYRLTKPQPDSSETAAVPYVVEAAASGAAPAAGRLGEPESKGDTWPRHAVSSARGWYVPGGVVGVGVAGARMEGKDLGSQGRLSLRNRNFPISHPVCTSTGGIQSGCPFC